MFNVVNFDFLGMTYNVLDFSEIKIVTGDALTSGKNPFPKHQVTLFQHIKGTRNYERRDWLDSLVKHSQTNGDFKYYVQDSDEWTENIVVTAEELRDILEYHISQYVTDESTTWVYGDYAENIEFDFTVSSDLFAKEVI